ncbi:MAG: ATP synthase F1 subunit epsilon [Alphaproteobacteria bacterium]|jgi:F-type H+-transporting ATPase subunit epsilon|nr:ATP synthase F1 subunit epsilon [Alphaproteobacteria bacterium]MBT5389617.1 ATP synthase F1 subunit epsilon [Alphaproteobacteria bacterium]MBT5540722.1 ATP synthase F1 subunit epsilon [Alphaproteobacteria bacterium]MBT5654861.1 ATP synthase F1 subunit epsilon [Alphaproteobacteria bacterium]
MDSFQFFLITPEQKVLSETVEMLTLPGLEGDFGILCNHAPLAACLRPGLVKIHTEEKPLTYFISHGYCRVSENEACVLVEEAAPIEDLDREELEALVQRQRKHLNEAPDETKSLIRKDIAILESKISSLSGI